MTWETVPLGDALGSVATGFASRDNLDEGTFQIRMNNLTSDGRWDWSKRRRVTPSPRQRASSTVVSGDVIFNATNSPELVGKSGLMPPLDEPAVISNHFLRLRTRPETLNAGYLQYWLLQQFKRGVFRARAKAWINQATLDREVLLGMRIPLPPLPEQRRIAAILDEADALRQRSRDQQTAVSQLVQQSFAALFTRANPRMTTIGALIQSSQYGTSQKAQAQGKVPVLRMGNITVDGRIDLTDMKFLDGPGSDDDKYLVRAGDVLFNRTNSAELVGKTAVYREQQPRAYAGYLVRLRPLTAELGEYIAGYLNSRVGKLTLRKMAKSIVGMANINAKEASSIRLPEPDPEALAAFLDVQQQAEAQRLRFESRSGALGALFASLQHRAFRGEL